MRSPASLAPWNATRVLVVSLVIVCLAMHAPKTACGESRSVNLEVTVTTPAHPARVNPRVYGLVCAEMITKGYLDEPEYVDAVVDLQFKVLLYPGGSASYWHHPTGQGGLNARPEEVQKSARGELSRWMSQTSGPDDSANTSNCSRNLVPRRCS